MIQRKSTTSVTTRTTWFIIFLFVIVLLLLYFITMEDKVLQATAKDYWNTLVVTTTLVTNTAATDSDTKGIVINRDEVTFPKERVQMNWKQVSYILQHLPMNGNLLIWGLGYDSIFWNTVTSGTVVFLEDGDNSTNLIPMEVIVDNDDNDTTNTKTRTKKTSTTTKYVRWYDSIMKQYPQLHAYTVNYTTKNTKEQLQYYIKHPEIYDTQLLMNDIPNIVYTTKWDVIIIDAPLGYPNTGPGRFQSIYMTKKIIDHYFTTTSSSNSNHHHKVHVFVDDYERIVEREFSQIIFGSTSLYHIEPRPAYKQHVTPNEQAHYIITSSSSST